MTSPVVLFETLWAEVSDGWAIAARAYARAMRVAGADVRLHSWAAITEDPAPEVLAEVEGMLRACENGKWDFYVFSTPLASPEIMREPLDVLRKMPRPRAFYTMFERSSVQGLLVDWLNDLEGVLVPCSRNQRALVDAGCKNSSHVPFPYFDGDPHLAVPPPGEDQRRFYWIGRWEPRKAPDNLVRAFLRAFKPGEATLLLKLAPSAWTKMFPTPEEVVASELDGRVAGSNGWTESSAAEAIEVVRGRLTPDEMLAIHARSDVYVSASRGEGIELGAYAAKLAGRRIVTTDSGGPADFLTDDDVLVPTTGLVTAVGYEGFWGRGTLYADYDLDLLVGALQVARAEPRPRVRGMPERFRAESVGRELMQWIEGCRG